MKPSQPVCSTLRAIAFAWILPIAVATADVVIPADKIIPAPDLFDPGCAYLLSGLDDNTKGYVKGEPFKADQFPYTAEIDFEKPDFHLSIYYWPSAAEAQKSLETSRSGLAEISSVVVDPIQKEGSRSWFTYKSFDRVDAVAMTIENVHFAISDQQQSLGKEKTMQFAKLFAGKLEKAASVAKARADGSILNKPRKWKNQAGKEIEGSITAIDAANKTVNFVRTDGTRFDKMPIATFSQADQDIIAAESQP